MPCRGYRAAMDFVETLDSVDADRISIWGDSYSGGKVILVGAIDDRVKVIVTQCPALGAVVPSEEANRANFDSITETFLRGDVAGSPETPVGPLPVVSCDQMGTPSLLKPIQAYRWFIDYGGRAGSHWANYITRVVPAAPVRATPDAPLPTTASFSTPCSGSPEPARPGPTSPSASATTTRSTSASTGGPNRAAGKPSSRRFRSPTRSGSCSIRPSSARTSMPLGRKRGIRAEAGR